MDDLSLKRALDALPKEIEPPADEWPQVRARLKRRPVRWLRMAALLALLAMSAGTLLLMRQSGGQWTVIRPAQPALAIEAGHVIQTGDAVELLAVGSIGTVELGQRTDAQLLQASWSWHKLAVLRGSIHARINAPPRVFMVETPAGVAVDLGCEYTLEVDSAGISTLRVTAGWVSFESRGRRALIPAGMHAVMRPGGRTGTPIRDSATVALISAVTAFDSAGSDSALAGVLATATRADAVTLWHLVGRTQGEARIRVVDRLTGLVPPPASVTRESLLLNFDRQMQLYWTELPGTLPIIPGWRRTLWLAWLRVFG